MSSNLNYKQVANVERRTWDVEEYEKKAQTRAAGPKAGDKRPLPSDTTAEDEKEEFRPAEKGAAGPERSKRAFLKARRDKVDIDSKVGLTEIVSAEAVATTSTKLDDDATGSIKVGVDTVVMRLVDGGSVIVLFVGTMTCFAQYFFQYSLSPLPYLSM